MCRTNRELSRFADAEAPATLHFATDVATINLVFETKMTAHGGLKTSCMYGKFNNLEVRPYHVYADSPDVAVAYAMARGEIIARSVVSTKDRVWVRLYSANEGDNDTDCGTLNSLLKEAGYKKGELTGNRLTKLYTSKVMLPYIDNYGAYVRDDGAYWTVVARLEEAHYQADKLDGTATALTRCDSCRHRRDRCRCTYCDICRNRLDDCACTYCECCGESYDGGCEDCAECDVCGLCEVHDRCACERCSSCKSLMEDCTCSRCSSCERLMEDCTCSRCSSCERLMEDCTCSRCSSCKRLMEDCERSRDMCWTNRELSRFADGTYRLVPVALNYPPEHFVHLAVTEIEPDYVAYTPCEEYGVRDRQVRLKFGRYLRRAFPGMTDAEIQARVTELKAAMAVAEAPATLHFATDVATINLVFETKMTAHGGLKTSCMYGKFNNLEVRPYHVYADSPDVAVAYAMARGEIIARSVVSTKDRVWVRLYSANEGDNDTDCGTLNSLLKEAGYKKGELTGNRLTKLYTSKVMLPYIDNYGAYVRDDGAYWTVVARLEEADYEADKLDGTATALTRCDSCRHRRDRCRCTYCDICRNRRDDCACTYCECCGESYNGGCEDCAECDVCGLCEVHDRCECERCSSCERLMEDCTCSRCSSCERLMEDCTCSRCSSCERLMEDCECEEVEPPGPLYGVIRDLRPGVITGLTPQQVSGKPVRGDT